MKRSSSTTNSRQQTPTGDPIGCAALEYLDNLNGHELLPEIQVQSDTMASSTIAVPYLFRSYEQMPHLEQVALDHCQGRVLDVGAGAGCHSRILQARGFEVLPIDHSEGCVQALQRQGFETASVVDIYYPPAVWQGRFDTILLLMNGIGLAGTLDNLEPFLQHLTTFLAPKGQILVDSSDLIYLYEQPDGSVEIPLQDRYYGEVRYQLSYKNQTGAPFSWIFVDPDHLSAAAQNLGLRFEYLQQGDHYDFLLRLECS